MSIPSDLRPILGKRELKKSLKTSNLVYARKAAYCYAVNTQVFFEEVRSQIQGVRSHMFNDDDIKRLSNNSIKFEHGGIKINGSSIEIGSAKTDPNNPNDIKDLNSYIDKIKELFPNAQVAIQPVPENSKKAEKSSKPSLLLQELFNLYKVEKKKEDWSTAKTEKDHDATFSATIRILGNISVTELTAEKAVEFKEILYNYPQNVTKKEAYNNLSISQFKGLKIPKEDLLKPPTIRKYLTRMSSVFDYAVAHQKAKQNPFKKIIPKRKKSKRIKKRDQFTPEELKTLFSTDIYTAHNFDKPHHYWLPLLGLLAGARLSELCQLRLKDIQFNDGIQVISINEESDDQSVKTEAGIRSIPVHSILNKFGFSQYIQSLETAGEDLLFPDITPYFDIKYQYKDWGHYPSKWFAAHLKKLEIKHQKLVFHSLRHTMITKLDNARVHRAVACYLTGHEENAKTHDDYIHGFEIDVMHQEIEKINFDDVLALVKPYCKR